MLKNNYWRRKKAKTINVINCKSFFSLLCSFNEKLNFVDENFNNKQYLLIVRYQLRYDLQQMAQINDLKLSQKAVLRHCQAQIDIVSEIISVHDILDVAE